VHGNRIAVATRLNKSKKFPGVDGLLTDQANLPLAIFTADCASIFIADKKQKVVGVLHAGWRGVQTQILAKAVRLIWRKWRISSRALSVWLGPCIGPCCFEVQWDVARHFPKTRRRSGDRWTVHLARELRLQAKALGVGWLLKNTLEECTMHGSRHFSYRRDKTSKRQASIIMKREQP
jgi:YfiH family protein